jgi:plastocyanin
VTIATGGTVTWQFTGSARHNVTFSGAAPAGGNIPDTDAGASVSRTFGTAGTYGYQCTRHAGMTGQVIVSP